uniref:Uncharacterized protein n=1 Tax=Histophilus somni (strain 129Pt) TaxID=205914 RepID=Q0I4L4_HISS1
MFFYMFFTKRGQIMGILNSMSEGLQTPKQKPLAQGTATAQPQNISQPMPSMAQNVTNNLNSNSLLMKSAAQKGNRMAAQRGLQNSTIGIESAQRAMLDVAMPIAQQDTQNRFASTQAGLDRTHQTDMARLNAQLSHDNAMKELSERNRFASTQAGLDRTHQTDMARLNAQLSHDNAMKELSERNRFASTQAGLDRTHQTDMARLNAQLSHDNAMKELSERNRFASTQAGLDRTHQTDMARLNAQLSHDNAMKELSERNRFASTQAGLDRTHQTDMARLNAQLSHDNAMKELSERNRFASTQAGLDRTHQTDMARLNAQLSHDNAMKELGSQVSANTIGKSIDYAMQITNNFDAQIAGVLNNTQMKEEDKKKAIEQLKASRDTELSFMSKFMQKIPTTQKDWAAFPSLGVPTITMK